MHTQIWMVEQQWKIGEGYAPIRGVVRAKTKRKAQERAEEGCRQAAEQIGATECGQPASRAYALYPIAYE